MYLPPCLTKRAAAPAVIKAVGRTAAPAARGTAAAKGATRAATAQAAAMQAGRAMAVGGAANVNNMAAQRAAQQAARVAQVMKTAPMAAPASTPVVSSVAPQAARPVTAPPKGTGTWEAPMDRRVPGEQMVTPNVNLDPAAAGASGGLTGASAPRHIREAAGQAPGGPPPAGGLPTGQAAGPQPAGVAPGAEPPPGPQGPRTGYTEIGETMQRVGGRLAEGAKPYWDKAKPYWDKAKPTLGRVGDFAKTHGMTGLMAYSMMSGGGEVPTNDAISRISLPPIQPIGVG